jgi:TIR domain-containing protein
MAQVFTSYSRRDTQTVDTIVGKMTQAGIDVWLDRADIQAGNTWRVQIVQAIDTCPAFVLMLSPNSAASDNVRKEIDLSQDSGRTIFAVMLEPVRLPAEIRYQLAGLQFIDVQMLGFDQAVSELIETVREHLAKLEPVKEPETRQAELVIQGIDLGAFTAEKREQLLDFISKLTSASRSQLQIANVAAGSVHVFVELPALAAFELKTLALNRDKRFKAMGITCLRLDGDTKFANTSHGQLTLAATISPLMALWLRIPPLFSAMLGAAAGKVLTLVLAAVVIAGAGLAVPGIGGPLLFPSPTAIQTPAPTSTPAPTATLPSTLTATQAPTLTLTPTATEIATPTLTASPTFTPVPTYQILTGVVLNRIACRYGPGDVYLYQFGLIKGNRMEVRGRVEARYGDEMETWLWGLAEEYRSPCWVNARDVTLRGDIASLETIYPGKVKLPLTTNWPAPQNVKAVRKGDQVSIFWDAYLLPPGERESEESPRYLAELWLCQGGKVAFTPVGVWNSSLVVTDEAGCVDPSHGRLYLAEKHGYVGPVEISWPSFATPVP